MKKYDAEYALRKSMQQALESIGQKVGIIGGDKGAAEGNSGHCEDDSSKIEGKVVASRVVSPTGSERKITITVTPAPLGDSDSTSPKLHVKSDPNPKTLPPTASTVDNPYLTIDTSTATIPKRITPPSPLPPTTTSTLDAESLKQILEQTQLMHTLCTDKPRSRYGSHEDIQVDTGLLKSQLIGNRGIGDSGIGICRGPR